MHTPIDLATPLGWIYGYRNQTHLFDNTVWSVCLGSHDKRSTVVVRMEQKARASDHAMSWLGIGETSGDERIAD